jgi:hypothetical protein
MIFLTQVDDLSCSLVSFDQNTSLMVVALAVIAARAYKQSWFLLGLTANVAG